MPNDWQELESTSGICFSAVGTSVGSAEEGPMVGLIYPKGPTEEDGEVEVFMTLPAAKSLLIDLRDAVEAAEKLSRGEDPNT